MKIELTVYGGRVVIEAEGAVCLRVPEDEGEGRLGACLDERLEALRREIAEEAGYAHEEEPSPAAQGEEPTPAAHGDMQGMELFGRLVCLRREVAAARGVPAYVVFNDMALKEMAEKRPQDMAGLSGIKGVGRARLEKYGEMFLAAIKGAAA